MPRVIATKPPTTQARTPTLIRPSPNGSLLGRAGSVTTLPRQPLRLLFYGDNRVGKNTLAAEFRKPMLVVSFEPGEAGGTDSMRATEGIHFLRVVRGREPDEPEPCTVYGGFDGAHKLAFELMEDTHFRTVVIDGATSAQDMALCEIMDWDKYPSMLNWGMVSGDQYRARSGKTRDLLRPFGDLPQDVIFLSKEKDHNPPREEKTNERTGKVQPDMRPRFLRGTTDKSFIAAALGGETAGWLQDTCRSGICRLFVEEEVEERSTTMDDGTVFKQSVPTGKYVRYLRVAYHPNYAGGLCTPRLDVPDVLKGPSPRQLYDNLMDALGVPAEER